MQKLQSGRTFALSKVIRRQRFAEESSGGAVAKGRRSGQSVTASDFGSNGPRFESGRGRSVESLDKALYSHCPKEKPSHLLLLAIWPSL